MMLVLPMKTFPSTKDLLADYCISILLGKTSSLSLTNLVNFLQNLHMYTTYCFSNSSQISQEFSCPWSLFSKWFFHSRITKNQLIVFISEILERSKDVTHDVKTSVMSRKMSRLRNNTINKQ